MLSRYGLFLGLLVILLLLLIWPIYLTVQGAFFVEGDDGVRFSLDYFFDPDFGVLRDELYRAGLINATLIALCTTTLCLLITLPMALIATRYKFPGKGAITSLVLVPLILPPFVGAIGLQAILGRAGMVNSLLKSMGLQDQGAAGIDFLGAQLELFGMTIDGRFWAVVIMQALHLYPILYLNIAAALANLDPSLDEAALNLGSGRWRRFWRCTLPLILPGIFAGGTIVLIWSFTELGTPLIFEYKTVTPVQVFYGLQEIESSAQPYALVVVMLIAAVLLYLIGKFALGGKAYAMQSKATHASTEKPMHPLHAAGALALFLIVTGLAVLPHLGVILVSISTQGAWYDSVLPTEFTATHFGDMLTHNLALPSIVNSLKYALIAMVLCVAMGLAIAYLNVRAKVKGGIVLDTLGMLPLAVPGLVMAFGYVAMSLHWPFPQLASWFQDTLAGGDPEHFLFGLGSLFQVRGQAPNPLLFLVIAYTIRRLPYILRSASAGLEQTSGQLEEAALNLGATPMTAIRRIVVPLIMANLIAGGILVFSFAMLEVSDSLILAEKEVHYPITKAIWTLFARLGDGPYIASAMGVWGMALLTLTLVTAAVLMGKKLGAVFRV